MLMTDTPNTPTSGSQSLVPLSALPSPDLTNEEQIGSIVFAS